MEAARDAWDRSQLSKNTVSLAVGSFEWFIKLLASENPLEYAERRLVSFQVDEQNDMSRTHGADI